MIPLANNYFWFGVVENVNDPLQQGRLQVRIIGIHSESRQDIPTEDLPWAEVGLPITSAFISGVGSTPVGVVTGTTVGGIFKDGADMQEPVAFFALGGKQQQFQNTTNGFNDTSGFYPQSDYGGDVNRLARGEVDSRSPSGNITENQTEDQKVDEFPKEQTPEEVPAGTPWMPIALAQRGVNETANKDKVIQYHKEGGGLNTNEQTPWCASFVGWCLKQAKIKGTGSALARSYSNWGKEVSKDKIPYGAIIVLRGSRGPSSGHVCFATKDLGDRVEVIGGNQSSDAGKKYDNGGMVSVVTFKKEMIVACRMPA